jgi:hypothetical protein
MPLPKVIEIAGQRIPWRDVLKLRREQAQKRPVQATLFPLREDKRPASQRTASGRFEEPPLFKID